MSSKNKLFFLFSLWVFAVVPALPDIISFAGVQGAPRRGEPIESFSKISPLVAEGIADMDNDGFPDAAELIDETDRVRFRRWFTAIAESQFYAIHSRWPKIRWDCTGLICFAYKEALKTHNDTWLKGFKYVTNPAVPDIKAFHYPAVPLLKTALFRSCAGPLQGQDLENGTFQPVAEARVLMDYNCRYLGNRLDETIMEGDLLFFRYDVENRTAYHSMILVRNYSDRNPAEPDGLVVYHTGPDGQAAGEVRKCLISTLNHHPDDIWHVKPNNPHFMGFYRFNILDYRINSDDQGALFEKTAPWTPAKAFDKTVPLR